MSHAIEIINGEAQMVYVGQVPWHGLGTQVDPDLTPIEMMKAAGLDWKVERRDVFFEDDNGNKIKCGKKQALVRGSDGKYLDVVSSDWIPVQNEEAFNFFTDYVKAGGLTMHTAGSLKGGRIIWGLAKVEDSFELFGGKDKVDSYLLLSNPHHYGKGVDVRFTPIRVVCNNTLSMSLDAEAAIGINLNHRQEFDVERVKEALDEASQKMENYREMAEFLATKRYNQETVFEYFANVFPKTSNVVSFEEAVKRFRSGDEKAISRNTVEAMALLERNPGAEFANGTWWNAFNTVTYMTNHVTGHKADTRMQSVWFGTNKDRNMKALGMALEYANAA